MKYIDQSASGLRFYLVADALDVTRFSVISKTSFRWDHQSIEMGILGASHYLSIRWNDQSALTELFACADVETETAFLKSAPFSNLPARIEVPFADKLYRFSPRIVSWNDGAHELSELRRAIAGSSGTHRAWGLEHQFPSPPGADGDKPPLTLVYAEVRGQFVLKTAHCYPNEEQIVFTTTTMSKRG